LRVFKASDGKDSFTELPLTPHYQQMAEECAKLFDGIDFFTIRLAHSKSSDQEVILDVQDFIEIKTNHEREDMARVKQIVIANLTQLVNTQKDGILSHKKKSGAPPSDSEDVSKNPFGWIQSLIIIILLALLYATHQASFLPRDIQNNIVPPFHKQDL